MNRIVFAAVMVCLALPTFAADALPPAKIAKIEVTAQDLQVLALALNKAAATCAVDAVACQIGELKGPLIDKLNAANAEIAKPK